jgi:hypothetical protein
MSSQTINIKDEGGPALQRVIGNMKAPQRLHAAVAARVEIAVRNYIRENAPKRHTTATKLHGTPTGFYGVEVGESVKGIGRPEAAVVSMHSAMKRAFDDVLIKAIVNTYLTLPLSGASYGYRIRKGFSDRFKGGFFFKSKKGNLLYAIKPDPKKVDMILLYLLRTEVKQKMDRTLLPSDVEIKKAAIQGAIGFIDNVLRETVPARKESL